MKKRIINFGIKARKACKNSISNNVKNKVLRKFSYLIKKNTNKILFQNQKDISNALNKNLKKNMIKRLELNQNKIESITVKYNQRSFFASLIIFGLYDRNTSNNAYHSPHKRWPWWPPRRGGTLSAATRALRLGPRPTTNWSGASRGRWVWRWRRRRRQSLGPMSCF